MGNGHTWTNSGPKNYSGICEIRSNNKKSTYYNKSVNQL